MLLTGLLLLGASFFSYVPQGYLLIGDCVSSHCNASSHINRQSRKNLQTFYRPVLCREAFSWSSFLLRWPCLLSSWHKKVTSTLFKPLNILMFKYVWSLHILCGNVHLLWGSFCFPFCVCVCRYMHVWVPMHVCLCMWRSEDNLKCQPSGTWLFFFKVRMFLFLCTKINLYYFNKHICMHVYAQVNGMCMWVQFLWRPEEGFKYSGSWSYRWS